MTQKRPYNFSPGPSAIPDEVLKIAAAEMLDWHGTGMSPTEMSHRGPAFMQIYNEAVADLKELLAVPDNYEILLVQGGAIGQNSAIPLNLINRGQRADIFVTGTWSEKSFAEAHKYGEVRLIGSNNDALNDQYGARTYLPDLNNVEFLPDSSYVHLCSNETIGGVEWVNWPTAEQTHGVPLVVDASSNILSRPVDFSNVGVLFAGAQKNVGPSGVTIIIVRKDLIGKALPICPGVFDYALLAANESMYQTPPTYAIYLAGLVCKWLKAQGGITALEKINIQKAELLYRFIDQSDMYENRVEHSVRSRMNVPFFLRDSRLDEVFLTEAAQAGIIQIKGHQSVGGMRASIYNAMPLEGVQTLVDFMTHFEKQHG